MVDIMKVNMLRILKKVLENIFGKMEKSINFLIRYIGEWKNGV